jgi:hypothetical protein
MEYWNVGILGLAEWDLFIYGWHGPEDKIRPSSATDPQYSIFPPFHHSNWGESPNLGELSAAARRMNAVKSLRAIEVYLSKAGFIVKVDLFDLCVDGQLLSSIIPVFVDIRNIIN